MTTAFELGVRLWAEVQAWKERPQGLTHARFSEYVLPGARALGWLRHLESPQGEDARRDISERAFYKEGEENPSTERLSAVYTALSLKVKELLQALDVEVLSAKELIYPSETNGMWSLDNKAAEFLESQNLKEGAKWVKKEGRERWKNFQGALTLETERSHVLACSSLWGFLWENQELIESHQVPLVLVHMLARGLAKKVLGGFDLIGWNQANRLVSLAQARINKSFTLGYAAREFILCGLPYKPIKESKFTRQNGNFKLTILGDPSLGVPFGQDRLFIVWLVTAFQASGKPEHNRIYFRSTSDILKSLGIPIDGHEMQLLKERIERLFRATYVAEYKEKQEDSELWVAKRFQLMRSVRLWPQRSKSVNQHTLEEEWPNFIELDPHFANELRARSVPNDMNTLIALKRSPALLDFYLWQIWRSNGLLQNKQKEAWVPVFGPNGLWAQMGSVGADERYIKKNLRRWQKELLLYWPDCPNRLSSNADGMFIYPYSATPMGIKLNLPGVQRNVPQFRNKHLLLDDATEPSTPNEPAALELERPPGEDPFPEDNDNKLND
ncbi:MAG TPA: replication protein RepA [Lacunisphaera sp.]|nr:replication protein RepA [Lacunisphaera sp.]